MFETIYLTGATATGKSTLSGALKEDGRFAVFEYGLELYRRAIKNKEGLTHDDIRWSSEYYVTEDNVRDTDDALQAFVARNCDKRHAVIDSRAVTKEGYGFRSVPFTPDRLISANLSRIVVLYCDADALSSRIGKSDAYRVKLSPREMQTFIQLQNIVAASYSLALGIPLHFIDGDGEAEDILATFTALIGSKLH